MQYSITAPHGGTGVVAGVAFTDGHATATDPGPGALLYFRRRGYDVELLDDTPAELTPPAPAKGRTTRTK
ncbi:hypothetical protein OHV05_15380 [Kitasatospora sp. NBC_00070]|uniref:hypothetical protein n=1 Tax=Kitasatospora sp. NBC_00070 TaxID=2975962 RepID=UPI0032542D19